VTGYTFSTWANSWHNTLSYWTYLAINLCLRLAISVSISSRPNQCRHSAITSIDVVRKTFMRTLFKVNSNDLSWVLFTGHACNDQLKIKYWLIESRLRFRTSGPAGKVSLMSKNAPLKTVICSECSPVCVFSGYLRPIWAILIWMFGEDQTVISDLPKFNQTLRSSVSIAYLFPKFRKNLPVSCKIILLTNRQANRGQNITPRHR